MTGTGLEERTLTAGEAAALLTPQAEDGDAARPRATPAPAGRGPGRPGPLAVD